MDRKLICLMVSLGGCAAPRTAVPVTGVAPQTTAEACAEIRNYFARHGHYSVSSPDMSAGCHMRITAEYWRRDEFHRYLETAGFKRDPGYRGHPIFDTSAWLTSSTRCTLEEILNHIRDSHRYYAMENFLGEATQDYKIDCVPLLP